MWTRMSFSGPGLAVVTLVLLFLSGCPTPCGTFSFTGAPHTNRGVDVTVNFDFNPAKCKSTCDCNTVAYIQIVRIVDLDTGNFLSPNSEQTDRMVTGRAATYLNGWAVDRLAGRVWGYYGRNNNGTFASTLTPGSNTTDAVLRDSPSGWPDGSLFDAVSVPVCINADAPCANQLLGYYYWLFLVNSSGTASDPFHSVAGKGHCDAVDEAVTEWNNDAAGLGKNSFPSFTRMGM